MKAANILIMILALLIQDVSSFAAITYNAYFPCHTRLHLLKSPARTGNYNTNYKAPVTKASKLALTSLISPTDVWGNWSFLIGMATLAQVLGKATRIGRLLGPPVTAMALTFTFASIGVLPPGGTSAAKAMQLLSLQLATPLLLLGADLRDCVSRCGALLEAFCLASVATTVACIFGWLSFGGLLTTALGRDGLVVAAALMAKNIGGGINYVAVCQSLSASPEAFAAGLCVDNIFGLIYFPLSSALASGRPDIQDLFSGATANQQADPEQTPVTIRQMTTILWLGSVLTWIGEKFGGAAGALPLCTLMTVLLASLAPQKWIQYVQPASNLLGSTALYLFFATAGAPGLALAESVEASIVPLGLFLASLYGIHALILIVAHRLRGGKGAYIPQRLLVASSAAIGGPATAAALAQASGWKSLMVPSLIVGNLGYAIATFIGLAYYSCFVR